MLYVQNMGLAYNIASCAQHQVMIISVLFIDVYSNDIVQLGPKSKQSLSLKVWTKDEH